jgi:hypothetical protein
MGVYMKGLYLVETSGNRDFSISVWQLNRIVRKVWEDRGTEGEFWRKKTEDWS